jgi:hypothetical protein
LVPTPSVPLTSMGSLKPAAFKSNKAPNPPSLDVTPGRLVDWAKGLISSTKSLPASISTPESL